MPRAFTEKDRHRIRARLLAAGRSALPRTGFRRTAVEDLTRAAGISKGAFYRFFETKEALWIALLEHAEAEARATIRAALADRSPGRLRRTLDALFRTVWSSPVLRVLADPEELAWLTRALPPEQLAAARADDDRFFAAVWQELARDGDLTDDVPVHVLTGLPAVAMGVAQQRDTIGAERADAVRDLLLEALEARLAPRR